MRDGLHILSGAFKPLFTASHIATSARLLDGRHSVITPFFRCEHQTDRFSEDSVNLFGNDHEFTKLVIDLKGKDPDDAFSSIPYEKASLFCLIIKHILIFPGFPLPLLPREARRKTLLRQIHPPLLQNLAQKIPRLLRFQVNPPFLLRLRRRSIQSPFRRRLGHLVLRPRPASQAKIRHQHG
jgi:hypothetical protein